MAYIVALACRSSRYAVLVLPLAHRGGALPPLAVFTTHQGAAMRSAPRSVVKQSAVASATRTAGPRRRRGISAPPLSGAAADGRPDRNFYTVVLIDVSRSAAVTGIQRQRKLRNDLYDLVDSVVDYDGLSLDAIPFSDTGDGLRLCIPLNRIQPTHVVDLFVLGFTARLQVLRGAAAGGPRMRLRVAFDLGLVEPHRDGWAGEPLVRVARLIDAQPLRDAMRPERGGPDVGAVVSDVLFDSVIRHGHGYLTPSYFQPVQVRVKEFAARAWLLSPCGVMRCGRCDRNAA